MKTSPTRRASPTSRRTGTAGSSQQVTAGLAEKALLRMRDLVRQSGLPRETIHFYKQQGLLPAPVETGRNTALYTQAHVDRLRRIRELQERHFLPLKAIRAVLDDTADEGFTPEQEDLVRRVRGTLAGWANAQQRPTVEISDFVPKRLSARELRELAGAGLISIERDSGVDKVSEDDAVILECWARFKEVGMGPAQGFTPAELRLYQDSMEQLVAREARVALQRYTGAGPEELSRVVEQVGPVIARLLGAMHRKQMRRFLAEVGSGR